MNWKVFLSLHHLFKKTYRKMIQKKVSAEISEQFDFVVASQKPVQHKAKQSSKQQKTKNSQQHSEFWL